MNVAYRIAVTAAIMMSCTAMVRAQGWSQPLPTNTSRGLNGLFSVSSMMTIAVGNLGTIVGTSDGGNTWNTAVSGTTENLRKVFVSGLSSPVITVVGDNGTILRSTNGGFTWTPWTSGVTLDLHDIFVHDPVNGTTMTIVGENGVILWTNNGGSNWILRLSPVPSDLNGVFFKTLLEGFAVGDNGVILRTFNNGSTWSVVTSGTQTNLHHVYFTHPDTGWIVGDGGLIMTTTDGGTSWGPATSPVSVPLRRIMFTSTSNGHIVGDNGVILHTADGGVTWNQQNSGTGNDLTSVFFVDANYGMVTGERGLVISTYNGGVPVELRSFSGLALDDGAVRLRWETETETQNFGFEVLRRTGTEWETLGFVAGHGDSRMPRTYDFIDHLSTDVRLLHYRLRQIDYDGGSELLPEISVERGGHARELTLAAWPNPFPALAQLHITLPHSAGVHLRIHDISGRLVGSVFDGILDAGAHVLRWDAAGLPAGRYLAVLETDEGDMSRRRTVELILQK